MSKRLLSALVALCMALTLMPSWAFAEEPDEAPELPAENAGEVLDGEEDKETPEEPAGGSEEGKPEESGEDIPEDSDEVTPEVPEEEIPADDETDPDDGEVFITSSAYLEDDEDDPLYPTSEQMLMMGLYQTGGISQTSGDMGTHLSGQAEIIYNALVNQIEKIMDGTAANTYLLVSSIPGLNIQAAGFMDAFRNAVTCLMLDYPESFFWWGRSYGIGILGGKLNETSGLISGGTQVLYVTVSEVYSNNKQTEIGTKKNESTGKYERSSGYVTAGSKVASAKTAIQNASSIITENAGKSDYDKLLAYKDKICQLVDYDYGSLGSSVNPSKNADPWAIIHVFDQDTATKVVCEGYSKAFQYLCDLSTWTGYVKCYTVSGEMTGGTGAGPHMWNIVSIGTTSSNAKNYLVDVTNSDSGSAGEDGELFMAGTSGSADTGYAFSAGNQTINYDYDATTKAITSPASVLTLAGANYTPPRVLAGTVAITGTPAVGQTLTASTAITSSSPGTLTYTWTVGGTNVSGSSQTYVVKNTDAGKQITVTVTAANYPDGGLTSAPVTVGQLTAPTAADFTSTIAAQYAYTGVSMADELTALVSSSTHAGRFTIRFSPAAPLSVGTYQVLADVAAHDAYSAVTGLVVDTFEITKAAPALSIAGGNSVSVGQTLALTASVTGLSGLESQVRWTVSGSAAAISPASGGTTTVTGVSEGTVTVTAALEGTDNYNGASAQTEITVSTKPAQRIAFSDLVTVLEIGDEAVNSAAAQPPAGTDGPIGGITYSSSDPSVATVDPSTGAVTAVKLGTVTITATVAETDDFASASASYELEVVAEIITPEVTVAAGPHKYTGSPITPAVTVLKELDGAALTEDDYTLEWADNTDAGIASVTVKHVPGGNYSWNPVTVAFTIDKADPKAQTGEVTHGATISGARSFTLDLEDCGTVSAYGEVTANDEHSILDGTPSVGDGKLNYTLAGFPGNDVPEAGWTAALTFTVTAQNYDIDYMVTVKVLPLPVPAAPTNVSLSYTQSGTSQYIVTVTATPDPNFADTALEYSSNLTEGSWQTGNTFTVDAGAAISEVEVRTQAVENVNVEGSSSTPVSLTTPPAFSPNGGTFRGSQEVTLSAPGASAGTKIYYTTNGQALDLTPGEDGNPTNGKEYTEAIKLTSTTTVTAYLVDTDNENAILAQRAVAFTRRSSSSGGSSTSGESIVVSGSSSRPGTTPSTPGTTTPSTPGVSSGSGTTTAAPSATVKDGTASATVSGTIGKDLVDQAAANGSDTVVIAPSIPSSADQTEVSIGSSVLNDLADRTDADLRVETPAADVTISNKGLSSLAGKGGSVLVSTSAKGDTFDVSITAGGSKVDRVTGGVKVEIPTSCTPGTVAMITKADGSTELVRKSVANASSGTVSVPLEGSASITLMDNSKSFSDVPAGNTFAGAVAFVSSREIMSGTGANTFNPSAPLTRAQLAKILHNLESNPSAAVSGSFSDVANDFWSAEAIQWASDKGIVTGYADGSFKPNSYITREQLAVMLYRYAGSPNIRSSELRFSDAASVGSYAQAAMIWATQNGVVNGSGGMLNPKGQATRAQAAQMLLNYMNNVG